LADGSRAENEVGHRSRLFGYLAGVLRWSNRVTGYGFTFVTDRYPPFSLR